MGNIKEVKKDLYEYVISKGWIQDSDGINSLFFGDISELIDLRMGFFMFQLKGTHLINMYHDNKIKLYKHLLEYVGKILRKHNITEIYVWGCKFYSIEWVFDKIEKV